MQHAPKSREPTILWNNAYRPPFGAALLAACAAHTLRCPHFEGPEPAGRDLSNSDDAVLYSPVSVAELWTGARPKEYEALRKLFLALTCAPIDEAVGHQAGMYLRQYRPSHTVEAADALIAASAVANSAELWTNVPARFPEAA